MVAKLFDLIFLDKFSDTLCTSELQFGFKAENSTTMCSMVLKESLAYYTVDGRTAFCTFWMLLKRSTVLISASCFVSCLSVIYLLCIYVYCLTCTQTLLLR